MPIQEQLEQLEMSIRHFEVEWRRFVNGGIDTPPAAVGKSVTTQIRNLRTVASVSTAERFQLRGLEARFNSLREHFGRRVRETEKGRGDRPRTETVKVPALPEVIVDSSTSLAQTRPLFETLYADRPGASHETFHRFLIHEAERLRTRTGCRSVVYFLRREADHFKLSARTSEAQRRVTSDE